MADHLLIDASEVQFASPAPRSQPASAWYIMGEIANDQRCDTTSAAIMSAVHAVE